MNTCDTCKFWSEEFNVIRAGFCKNEILESRFREGEFTESSLSAGETENYPCQPITGPKFGCIHWEKKG